MVACVQYMIQSFSIFCKHDRGKLKIRMNALLLHGAVGNRARQTAPEKTGLVVHERLMIGDKF